MTTNYSILESVVSIYILISYSNMEANYEADTIKFAHMHCEIQGVNNLYVHLNTCCHR